MPLSHPFAPLLAPDARVLILGSFPSVKSREQNFYYGHPQNRFWKVMAHVLRCPVPETISEKREMLLSHRVALYDTLQSCDITGSSDASIKNPVANNIAALLHGTGVQAIFCNGSTSYRCYQKYVTEKPPLPVEQLPSTSPANAQYRLEQLCTEWEQKLRPWL